MPVGPTMGAPLESPDNPESPGIARPSALLDEDSRQPSGSDTMPEPNRQVTQVLGRMKQMEDQLDQLSASYPAAASHLRAAKASLGKAQQLIVSAGGKPGETPSPRMLG